MSTISRVRASAVLALGVSSLVPSPRAVIGAQTTAADTAAGWIGQRIIMLQGLGAVHLTGAGETPRTIVGINLVMPVRRIEGRRVWIVSTSAGDSGWIDIGSVRLLSGAIAYFDSLIAADPRDCMPMA